MPRVGAFDVAPCLFCARRLALLAKENIKGADTSPNTGSWPGRLLARVSTMSTGLCLQSNVYQLLRHVKHYSGSLTLTLNDPIQDKFLIF